MTVPDERLRTVVRKVAGAVAVVLAEEEVSYPELFAAFMNKVRPFKVKVLAGILLLRNAKMAEFMNANIPGMSVPQAMIDELRAAGDKSEEVGVEIAVRSIKAVRPHCDGVHIMAIKGTHRLGEIITKAQLA